MNQNASHPRCPWLDLSKPDYVAYHDQEWGVPVYDDRTMFEYLTLESAQAGLSWYTVLRKRENYRKAFANFDCERVARYDAKHINRLIKNAGLIRNHRKLSAAVSNARCFLQIRETYQSFSNYIWNFVGNQPIVNKLRVKQDYPATSPESDALSRDLKQRGFKFIGSTICYAHLQAAGLVNDHSVNCFRRQEIIDSYPTKSDDRKTEKNNSVTSSRRLQKTSRTNS